MRTTKNNSIFAFHVQKCWTVFTGKEKASYKLSMFVVKNMPVGGTRTGSRMANEIILDK